MLCFEHPCGEPGKEDGEEREGDEREVGRGALPYGGRVADGRRVGRVLEEGNQERPREDGARSGDAALEIAACGQTFAEEGVTDTEHPAHRHAEEARGEKQADLLGRAAEDLLVVSSAARGLRLVSMGRSSSAIAWSRMGLDEKGEEAGEEPASSPAAMPRRR